MVEGIGAVLWSVLVFIAGMCVNHHIMDSNRQKSEGFKPLNKRTKRFL